MNYSFDFICFCFKIIRMIDAVLIQARTDGHPQKRKTNRPKLEDF